MTTPKTEPCPTCKRAASHWDGCSHVECPKRRHWGDASADLESFDALVPISQRADMRQSGPRSVEVSGYRKRAHIKDNA